MLEEVDQPEGVDLVRAGDEVRVLSQHLKGFNFNTFTYKV
jgi:hypothetical protein